MTLKKSDRLITTGYGRTKSCGNQVGRVIKRRGNRVFIEWEGTSFLIEEEMDIKEVRLYLEPKNNKK